MNRCRHCGKRPPEVTRVLDLAGHSWLCTGCYRKLSGRRMPAQAEYQNRLTYADWSAIAMGQGIPQVKMPRKLPADQLMAWSEAMQARQEKASKVAEVYASGL